MTANSPIAEDLNGPRLETEIDRWLARQGELSAVERFADHHDAAATPGRAEVYRDLLPASAPGRGEQYVFEVDLDACTGCKACVVACHNLNGLDEGETWRSVGLLVGGRREEPVLQHVTAACHHCVDPACAAGCPTQAYEKDAATGIVRHLDDQCIGCRYCTFQCPYDVPQFNERLGIVRKCDMCAGRLAEGEAPACAQGCPTSAIRIGVARPEEIAERAHSGVFLPAAPDPGRTLPGTRYLRAKSLPGDTLPADDTAFRPEHGHFPLVVMLVLTQLSVGAFLVGQLLGGSAFETVRPLHALSSLGVGLLALGASVLHLGRPLEAWRAVIGLRTSWLSREIVAFGGFAAAAVTFALGHWVIPGHALLGPLGGVVVGVGLAGVFCSVMVYADTGRDLWSFAPTALRFGLTSINLGAAVTLFTAVVAAGVSGDLSIAEVLGGAGRTLLATVAMATFAKLLLELSVLRHLRDHTRGAMWRSASLLTGDLYQAMAGRFALGWVGGVALPGLWLVAAGGKGEGLGAVVLIGVIVALTLGGELLARSLFFRSVSAPRMPGGVAA